MNIYKSFKSFPWPLLFLAVLSVPSLALAQVNGHPISPLSTGHSGTGANINITYHRCFWRVNPDSASYIKGYVLTKFLALQQKVTTVTFDMNDILQADSVYFRGKKLPNDSISQANNILTIKLTAAVAANKADSVTVYYQGAPPLSAGAVGGFTQATDKISGQKYICTLSESYEDKDWWPCKADMQDKIDSIDIWVSVPWKGADTFWVASNGRLVDSAIGKDSNRLFKFHSNYPIASYLVCFSAARYDRFYRGSIKLGNGSVPIVYNIIRGKTQTQLNSILTAMDKMNIVMTTLSSKYGDYPFTNDKSGFYEGLVGAGGMEHQTFSAIATNALADVSTLAHELAHQWFGDKVTFATWNDLWLAEGFARYSEALSAELVPALGLNPLSKMTAYKNNALSLSANSLRIPDSSINNSDEIWNSAYGYAVYERGAMVVSMLRRMCGDSLFFLELRNYLNSTGTAYKTATTDSLNLQFNKVLGRDISPFFNDYVLGYGNPTYTLNCISQGSGKLTISVASQTKSPGSNVNYFRTPVAVRVQGKVAGQDTVIMFFDWGNGLLSYAGKGISAPVSGNKLAYQLSFDPFKISFDPYSYTLAQGSAALPIISTNLSVEKTSRGNYVNLSIGNGYKPSAVYLETQLNGGGFETIGEMSFGNQKVTVSYHYLDKTVYRPASNIAYRAVYIDNAGAKSYSNIEQVTVNANALPLASLLGNPVNNLLKLKWNASSTPRVIEIVDFQGKSYPTKQIGSGTRDNIFSFDVSGIPAGTYSLIVEGAEPLKFNIVR